MQKLKQPNDREALAFEAEMEAHRVNIERLKARKAELDHKVLYLSLALVGRATASSIDELRDWLCYYPSNAASPDLVRRMHDYLEAMRTRLETERGQPLWLNRDHDYREKMFVISEFLTVGGSLYCGGRWTETGRALKSRFKGVSAEQIAFMGDYDLYHDLSASFAAGPHSTVDDLPEELRDAFQLTGKVNTAGMIGAVCIGAFPACGVSDIYSLSLKCKA